MPRRGGYSSSRGRFKTSEEESDEFSRRFARTILFFSVRTICSSYMSPLYISVSFYLPKRVKIPISIRPRSFKFYPSPSPYQSLPPDIFTRPFQSCGLSPCKYDLICLHNLAGSLNSSISSARPLIFLLACNKSAFNLCVLISLSQS